MQKQPDVQIGTLHDTYKQSFYKKGLSNFQENLKSLEEGEVYLIDNFLSDKTCENLIEQTEKLGYQDALITTGIGIGIMDKSVRDSQRCMIDDYKTAELLYPIFLQCAPLCSEGAYMSSVNERFRYLKYGEQGKFTAHCDGRFPKSQTEESMYTIHFYLNTVEEGGGTSFFNKNWKDQEKEVQSIKGRVVIFRQSGWEHQGDIVKKGLKYSVRNELMYKYLNDKEFEKIPQKVCGLCKKEVQFQELPRCKHKLVYCGCSMFNKFRKTQNYSQKCNVCAEQKFQKWQGKI